MNNKRYSLRKRLSYWFDNRMAPSYGARVSLLLIITLTFVVLVALLSAITHGGLNEHFGEDFIRSFMYSLGKGDALGPHDAQISAGYFFLMLLTIIYCLFFSAILIGLITNALRSKVEDLGKGQSHVIENDHTLILGFNDTTFALLSELMKANENLLRAKAVVILGDVDQKDMIGEIKKRIGWPKRTSKTRIVCRTGSIYNFDDLKRCSIETSSSVIINTESDFEAIKAIMACSYLLNESFTDSDDAPFLVSIIQHDKNLAEARLGASGQARKSLIILALNEVLARILVHTSRQPGLSDVFTELFNFAGSELYYLTNDPCYPLLYGKTVTEINQLLKDAYAIGIKRNDGSIVIEAPKSMVFETGDTLIVVKEDDDPLKILHHSASELQLPPVQKQPAKELNVLIMGVEPVLENALIEYSNYLPGGSSIHIVDNRNRFASIVTEDAQEKLKENNISISVTDYDISQKKQINKLLNEFLPDCIMILADEETADPEAEDERIMRILIYLREYRNRMGRHFSITCEMLKSNNKNLAAATEPDDFIISRQFSALMMSQISYNKDMLPLFKSLLSSEGFEIYMKPASWYLPLDESLDLITVTQMVAEKGESFIGMRQKINGHYKTAELNPVKYDSDNIPQKYTFSEDDYLVVLASDDRFPEYTS